MANALVVKLRARVVALVTYMVLTVISITSAVAADALPSNDANFAWDELGRRLTASQKVAALGPDLMGDEVSLSNGALSFSVTDVSIPGNSALPVEVKRQFSVKDRKDILNDGMLADWQIYAPNISGVFAPDWVNSGSNPGLRCSAATLPPVPLGHNRVDFWQGLTLNTEYGGDVLRRAATAPAPSDGNTYLWNTSAQAQLSCISSIKNSTGEGFVARTPDGLTYRFDWMAKNGDRRVKPPVGYDPSGGLPPPTPAFLDRRLNALYATRVEDRFGNYVEFTYTNAWNAPVRLTRIAASDGRVLTLTYTNGYVSRVSSGSRNWTYTVDAATRSLTRVQLPDGSAWGLELKAFALARIETPAPQYEQPPSNPGGLPPPTVLLPTDIIRTCTQNSQAALNNVALPDDHLTGTITHPSGAVGIFTVDVQEHGRNHVPLACSNVTTTGSNPPYWGYGNDPTDDVPLYAISSYSLTLRSKTLQGAGMPSATWTYSYQPNFGFDRYPGTTEAYPICPYGTTTQCEAPPCTSESCATFSTTTVQEPGGRWRAYRHGNTYRYNEGKLLSEEVGAGSTLLRTTYYAYDLSQANQAYLARFGTSLKLNGDGFQGEFHRPLTGRSIVQEGVTFQRTLAALDAFARPAQITRGNSLGYTRTDAYLYFDHSSAWVLGKVRRSTCTAPVDCAGQVSFAIDYDAQTALPVKTWKFGQVDQIITHHADGTVAGVADGRNSASVSTLVQLSQWKRGHPQQVDYPDGTRRSSVVNDQGWITSETDENGFVQSYAYDTMGRVRQVLWPTGDTTTWSSRTIEFRPLTSADTLPAGVLAGQWREMVSQGNKREATYYDAMWRPVLRHRYDASNMAGTLSAVLNEYDVSGRPLFESYPSRDSIPAAVGTWTVHDALDRVTEVRSDSELGQLITRTEYLPGIQTRVTDPRGGVSVTAFDAYDEPVYEQATSMDLPEGIHMEIDRDVHGKPISISRTGVLQ